MEFIPYLSFNGQCEVALKLADAPPRQHHKPQGSRALRIGSLVDQFGTPWTIDCEKQ